MDLAGGVHVVLWYLVGVHVVLWHHGSVSWSTRSVILYYNDITMLQLLNSRTIGTFYHSTTTTMVVCTCSAAVRTKLLLYTVYCTVSNLAVPLHCR